jgi:hypothetical protein
MPIDWYYRRYEAGWQHHFSDTYNSPANLRSIVIIYYIADSYKSISNITRRYKSLGFWSPAASNNIKVDIRDIG